MTIRTLIVDDEPVARRRLVRLLGKHPDIELVGECSGGANAIERIRADRPDLLFLDVQMPDIDGFGVLDALSDIDLPAVVFVTAYDEYALRAFEAHAIDYLLKPYDEPRFLQALARAKTWVAAREQGSTEQRLRRMLQDLMAKSATARAPQRLALRVNGAIRVIPAADIDWLEADGNYVRVRIGRTSHLVRNTLTAFEQQLDPRRFVRIHRRFIVNLDRIAEVQPAVAGDAIILLRDGAKLRLSRSYRARFYESFVGDRSVSDARPSEVAAPKDG